MTAILAKLKGFKTVLFGLAVAIVPILDKIANDGNLIALIPVDKRELALAVIGLLIIVLRKVTDTKIGKAE